MKPSSEQLALPFESTENEKKTLRKDRYVICKYEGDNGDLIVGKIASVRSNGDIVLVNLLSGQRAVKHVDILAKRNIVVFKVIAEKVIKAFQDAIKKGDLERDARKAARTVAVAEAIRSQVRKPKRSATLTYSFYVLYKNGRWSTVKVQIPKSTQEEVRKIVAYRTLRDELGARNDVEATLPKE